MSGRTTVGAGDGALGRDDTTDEQGLKTLVSSAIDVTDPVAIVYRENAGTLDEPVDEVHRYDTLDDLPDRPLDGWDELLVYTETHVYRWVGVGFDAGPERVPRDPGSLPGDD